jgi:hypothetical protein
MLVAEQRADSVTFDRAMAEEKTLGIYVRR